jgi:electron-transferring-flavoprotein dehydrogenase
MQVQNVRPGFKWGLWPGLINAALEIRVLPLLLGGSAWRVQHNFPDHAMTLPASECKRIEYPR